jgi:threonine/homoserine/homoserine lactone efflux protein
MSLAFLLTSLIIVAMPGTGALITLSAGLSRGARAGVVAALGCTLGIVPHLIAALTGTAALLRASGVAFDALRVVGVAYLLLMAVMAWRDKSELAVEDEQPARSPARVIASAMLANLLNPKLTVFFFAFLPQFVPPHAHHELQRLLLLSGLFMVMTFVVFVV